MRSVPTAPTPVLALALAAAAALPAPATAGDLRHFDDAALHAVQFVDANEGWAVGDDGAVWHSIDGGGNWERQPTGVRGSLRAGRRRRRRRHLQRRNDLFGVGCLPKA